jgi:signal transduction histidine kinase/response regulator RpfG family c-di-GMP phosphodiesterase
MFRRPPLWLSYSVSLATVLIVGVLRLYVFDSQMVSLGYGMPLLVALWHRNRPQLYFMAICFTVICYIKIFLMGPLQHVSPEYAQFNFLMTMITIWTATLALHAAIFNMSRVEEKTVALAHANQELEASNEELAAREEEISRQNSELQSQAEELERQQEELRHQAEELEHQAAELQGSNEQLTRRERGLQTLLESARWLRSDLSERDVMAAVCQAAVQVMEHGVIAAAVVQEKDGLLHLHGHHGFGIHGALKRDCPYDKSFASLIVGKKQTGFIADLQLRPDVEVPQPVAGKPFRSVLASPLFIEGEVVGAVEVYSFEPREWSEEEFKVIEWLAAQCALALQAIEYQKEVLVKRREAEDASIQKTRFLAAVSHDVRTPANAISLLADLIEQASKSPEVADLPELARDLKSNARSLIDLVSDVLDLARLDTGKLDFQPVEFSLPQLLQSEVRQFERIAAEKNIQIHASAGCDTLILKTDRMKLARILSNLVGNAVKFTEVGSVELHCDKLPGGGAVVTVCDTGCGIPEAALTRIFDEFYQIQNPERDRNKGSGLGLAICKRLVDSLGCSMQVESTLGVGTRFILKMPASLVVSESAAKRLAAADGNPRLHRGGKHDMPLSGLKILLVEDHAVTRKAAARLLEGKGAVVLQAATGRDAFELLAHEHPQAMLLDLMLPDVDGTDVLRFLQTNRPRSLKCILAVSGDVRDARVVEVKALGADDLVPKPLDVQKLLDAIAQRFPRDMASEGAAETLAKN